MAPVDRHWRRLRGLAAVADGYRFRTVPASRARLSYLGEVARAWATEEPPSLSPVEALVDGYRQWLMGWL